MKECVLRICYDLLIEDEGYRSDPYHDHLGYVTVGYGEKLSDVLWDTLDSYHPTTKLEARAFLRERSGALYDELETYGWIDEGDFVRSAVWVCLAYQVGVAGLNKFVKTKRAWDAREYPVVSRNMMDSLWARQTPGRAARYAGMISDGRVPVYYY